MAGGSDNKEAPCPPRETALYKHTVEGKTPSFAQEIMFVNTYHEHPMNTALHAISMPLNLYFILVGPSLMFLPFNPVWTQWFFCLASFFFYVRHDEVGAFVYTSILFWTYQMAINFGVHEDLKFGLIVALVCAVEQVIFPLVLGHFYFQRGNAAFRWQEAYLYANFTFVLKMLKTFFNYMGFYDELHHKSPPFDVPYGKMGVCKNVKCSNWSGSFSSVADQMFFPSTVQDLQEIVHLAKQNGKKIRMVGKAHSFNSSTVCDEGHYMVRTDWLKKIRVDKENMRATVEAGVTTDELDQELRKFGLCCPTNVLLKCVTWSGITQTGSHGSGFSPVSDWITTLTLVDGNGEVRVLKDNTGDSAAQEMFNAAIVGLGMCGLVYEMELKVAPNKNLHLSAIKLPKWPGAAELATLAEKFEQFEAFDFGAGSVVTVKTWSVTTRKQTWVDRFKYRLGSMFVHFPSATHLVKFLFKLGAPGRKIVELGNSKWLFDRVGDVAFGVHYLERLQDVPIHSFEFAMRASDIEVAHGIVEELCQEYKAKGRDPLLFTTECRLTPPSKALLEAGCLSGEQVGWFEIIGFRDFTTKKQEFFEFARLFSVRVLERIPSALPHWGKNFDVVPQDFLRKTFETRYGERLTKFKGVTKELDPQGLFLTKSLQALFRPE